MTKPYHAAQDSVGGRGPTRAATVALSKAPSSIVAMSDRGGDMSSLIEWFRGLAPAVRAVFVASVAVVVAVAVTVAITASGDDDDGASDATAPASTTEAPDAPDDDPFPDWDYAEVMADDEADETPPEPVGDPIPIEPVEDSGDEFFEEPDPVAIPALTGPIGDFTSNAVGCQSECVTRAQLVPKLLSANVGFEIETNVAATTTVWMAETQIFSINGVPQTQGIDPIADSGGPVDEWTTDLGPLDYSTTYHIVVEVTDLYGNSKYLSDDYTTVDSPTPGQLVGNGGGCYYQCIVQGSLITTDQYDTVLMSVASTVPVEWDIIISSDEIWYINDVPQLTRAEAFVVEVDSGTAIAGWIPNLEPDTDYNVVIAATDENGFTSHAIGRFRTNPFPRVPVDITDVYIRFERVTIIQDGDPVGRGEIMLRWGFEDGSFLGVSQWEKYSSGDVVLLPEEDAATWVSILPDGDLPNMIVNAVEYDYDPSDVCRTGQGGVETAQNEDPGCDTRTVVALTGPLPLSWIDELEPCSSFFTVPFGQDRPCLQITSQDLGNTWVHFSAIISFQTG